MYSYMFVVVCTGLSGAHSISAEAKEPLENVATCVRYEFPVKTLLILNIY